MTTSALDELYRRYSYDRNSLSEVPSFVRRRLEQVVTEHAEYRYTNRLLDVGFGAGALLAAGQEQSWEVFGTEHSKLAVEQANQNGFHNVVHCDLLDAPFSPGSFDIVTMVELVEHLNRPLAYLEKARHLLRPGGALYLTTPNGRGLSGRCLGLDWTVIHPPEHVQIFSPGSLRLGLAAAGFASIRLRSEGVNPYELAWRFRRSHRLAQAPAFDRVKSSYGLNARLSSSRTGQLTKAVANLVLSTLRLGDSLKVTAIAPMPA